MSKVTLLALVAAFGVALAPMASAQSAVNELGQTIYPADLAGVDLASIPAEDLVQLVDNPGLTPEALELVSAEVAARGGLAGLSGTLGLTATNFAALVPAVATIFIAALAAGGDGPSGTSDTQ
jgi:hypothetical protein